MRSRNFRTTSKFEICRLQSRRACLCCGRFAPHSRLPVQLRNPDFQLASGGNRPAFGSQSVPKLGGGKLPSWASVSRLETNYSGRGGLGTIPIFLFRFAPSRG